MVAHIMKGQDCISLLSSLEFLFDRVQENDFWSYMSNISKLAQFFLLENYIFECQEKFSHIGFARNSFLLPYHVCDKLFIVEVCQWYN